MQLNRLAVMANFYFSRYCNLRYLNGWVFVGFLCVSILKLIDLVGLSFRLGLLH